MKFYTFLGCAMLLAVTCGCEEEKAKPEVEAATPEAVAVEKGPTAAEKKAADEEAARKAEEEKKQAEVDANPLTECCRALGKQAFTLRSPEFHGASKVCGEALTSNGDLASVLPEIKKSLKDKTLPSECAAK